MKRIASLLGGLVLAARTLCADPLVVAFDRFHAAAPSATGGRLLYQELGCVNCHGGDSSLPTRRGPQIAAITNRLHTPWLREFLAAPAKTRPGTTMPHLLAPAEVEPVLHYLASLKPPAAPKPKPARHVNAARGRDLFHIIGCAACHAPDPEFRPPNGAPAATEFTHRSVAFPDLAAKYSYLSLSEFLQNPLHTRPDGRMPSFQLDPQDAYDLAGYLLNMTASDGTTAPGVALFRVDKALVAQGQGIVTNARCAACHELPAAVAAAPVAIKSADAGCVAADIPNRLPRYDLTTAQRDALRLFLREPTRAATPTEVATLTLQALNCSACHERDGSGGPDIARKAYFEGDHNLGDTGRYPPPLTGAGRKLQPEWLAKVLAGENRVRPYLKTKMPLYGAATKELAPLLGRADARTETPLPGGDDTAGRKLLGTMGGLGCITCHRWGERPSLGIQALDLSNLGQRLQPGWLHDYLVNPAGYRPGTLMPSFWPGGKASNAEILGGDTARQIASIYSFAKSANGEPEGFPQNQSGEFELVPKDHPIVQRTFLKDAGTHAILVGFPQGVHVAYDGKSGRPALAWRGRFFDAYNTWFSRFAPFEKPLGADVVAWPPASTASDDTRFLGYRLDAQRVPIFLLTIRGVRVEDRFEPIDGALRRTVKWDATKLPALDLTHPVGVTVTEDPGSAAGARSFTYRWPAP